MRRSAEFEQQFTELWNRGVSGEKIRTELGISSLLHVYEMRARLGLEKRKKAKPSAQSQRRQGLSKNNPANVISLQPTSAPVLEKRTVYPRSVVNARGSKHSLLVSGQNNAKIGAKVVKGPWAGMPIYTLTLEERATCPRSCFMYESCYGNGIHLARRHKHGPEFEDRLVHEVSLLSYKHPDGFVVRLHVLGDFYSTDYVLTWEALLETLPELHVYGYTARYFDDPESKDIAHAISDTKKKFPDRFRIRWSRQDSIPDGATVIDYIPEQPKVAEGMVCPTALNDKAFCANCGLCWSSATKQDTIVFVKHGPVRKSEGRKSV